MLPERAPRLFINWTLGGIRRIGNKPLPKLTLKSKAKEESKADDEKDSGSISERDYKNPKIIAFKTETESSEKPSWRDMEKDLQAEYPTLKLLYSRMEDKKGQIAISSHHTDNEAVDKLLAGVVKSAGFEYTFSIPDEDELKKFWEDHGSHYEMVTKQKIRRMKKRKHDDNTKGDGGKRVKTDDGEHVKEKSYFIAGATYANINKVKSKAKAIMNVKENGQKLEGYEEEFMKAIIKHHAKHDEKMKDFTHFIVDEHPSFQNTR